MPCRLAPGPIFREAGILLFRFPAALPVFVQRASRRGPGFAFSRWDPRTRGPNAQTRIQGPAYSPVEQKRPSLLTLRPKTPSTHTDAPRLSLVPSFFPFRVGCGAGSVRF